MLKKLFLRITSPMVWPHAGVTGMRPSRALLTHAIVCIALLGYAGRACAASFTYTALNAAGANVAYPAAANSHDQVVGHTFGAFAEPGAFVWSAGTLDIVSGVGYFTAINDDGIAVGTGDNSAVYASYDTKTGAVTEIAIPFCKIGRKAECIASGVNNAGDVVGVAAFTAKKALGFLWKNGVATKILPPHEKQSNILAINKTGDMLITRGYVFYNPLLYKKGSFTEIAVPGASETDPSFLTDSDAVGGLFVSSAGAAGFVLSGGTYTTYSPAGSSSSTVTGIGPAGQIFGSFVDATGNTHGFENVNGTYYQIDVPNSTYTSIAGIGPSGLIFGNYTDSKGSYGYVGKCPKKDVCTQ